MLRISDGAGTSAARRAYIEQMQARLNLLSETDEERDELRLQLARLAGGVGILKVGAHSKSGRERLHKTPKKPSAP